MEYGFGIPTRGPMATPKTMATLASRGEELGFSLVSVSDHIVIPKEIRSRYPYSSSGEFSGGDGECLEQLTLLSYLAGQTTKIRLLTSVMVVPHRSPVHTAKILATIDVLSGGRLIIGCGVGWMEAEFEALGVPPYEERGAVANEYIRAFKELWTSDNPTFEGKYCRFSDVTFAPKPIQKPHPPIWIGGESPRALKRAAQLGDGWYPIGANPTYPLGTSEQLSASLSKLRRYAEEAGRDPIEINIAYSAGWYDDQHASTLPNGERRSFTGTPEQIAGDIRDFEGLGVHQMTLGLQADTLDQTVKRMERFAKEVMPLVGG